MDEDPGSPPAAVAARQRRFTEEVLAVMERRGISRSELARRLGASAAYATKILRGDANFTLASMVKLAAALEAELEIGLRVESDRGRGNRVERRGVSPSWSETETATPPSRPLRPGPTANPPDASWRVW